MGAVIDFPLSSPNPRRKRPGGTQAASATIIILPVIRIERDVAPPKAAGYRKPRGCPLLILPPYQP